MTEKHFKPCVRGSWYLVFGAILGPAIILDNKADGAPWLWIVMTVLFVGLFIHRLGLSYRLDGERLTVRSWWGLGVSESVSLFCLTSTDVRYSFTSRVAGCGHVVVSSSQTGEGATLLAQSDPEKLADEIEALARKARDSSQTALKITEE